MEPQRGILHKTTLESTTLQQKSFHTTTLANHKRPHSDTTDPGQQSSAPKRPNQFQRASSIGKEVPELAASIITPVDLDATAPTSEYSQRRAILATPRATVDRSLSLSFPRYGLPDLLVSNLSALGIKEIYPWQKQCLLGPGLLNGSRNLVYTAPTGGGKSLVADILMLKRVLEDANAKALLVLPYVALVQEKVRWLRNVVQGIKRENPSKDTSEKKDSSLWQRRPDEDTVRVIGFFGGGKVRATWSDFDIGVCTFEKANTLINTAIDDCTITKLRAVVLDELHMLDDDHRGYLMELIATKLLSLGHEVQIIGMSATLQNIDLLSRWLNAHIYSTFYRPIPIEEYLVHEGKIYPASSTTGLLKTASQLASNSSGSQLQNNAVRIVHPSPHKEFKDPVLNAVVALAAETAKSGYGALVFCNSRRMFQVILCLNTPFLFFIKRNPRNGCENDARLISRTLRDTSQIAPTIIEKRLDLLADLRSLSTGLDPCLAETVMSGVAFHHAGLTTEERDLIAHAYDSGVLKVLTATCSLAAGINLPARRVILHNARMGRDLIGPSMLRQMRGRAGRKGKDEIGETYLCCRKDDLLAVVELMHAELPQISSGLTTDRHRIQRALLEIIAIRLANSRDSVDDYIQKTMLNLSMDSDVIRTHVDSSLQDLTEMGFIHCDDSGLYTATQLGKAVVASSLEPEDGAFVHREMQRALQAFVMDGEMHILYMFTPVQDSSVVINWKAFRSEMEGLDDSGLRVMSFLGLKPTQVNKMAQGGTLKETTPQEKETARIYRRFYLALQLRDLCNEMPIHIVSRKYDMPRGAVQTLAQTCQGFAAGMIKFCEQMSWGAMAAVLDHFSDRLNAGAKSDLLALAKITFIKSRTARVFYENGFKTVAAVANADPKELVPILMQAQPSKVRLKSKDEQKYEEKLLAKAKVIADSANRLWQMEMQQQVYEE
ncbi:P-loop containing nucleoside triphosphate hydrolase protein [Hypoxylon sp. EC38]|nr:P-loop containing nucleoside triphosphate hydrolase protein [Hypoxylon sp. EC38]